MARQKNDGKGRLGGRSKGTPNKNKPLKTFLRSHSLFYFTPDEKTMRSEFDNDILSLKPQERVNAELQLLKFHTPQMQATAIDMNVNDEKQTLVQRLSQLAAEEE